MKTTTFRITLLALFIALCVVGANVKVMGSIAFDSLPAFLAAFLIGGKEGAIAGAAGHLFSALLAGFPLTLPMHLAIAAEMAAICWLAGWLVQNKNVRVWAAAIPAFVLNAFISPLLVVVWPGLGWEVMLALLVPLVLASAANVAGATILAVVLKKPLKKYLVAQH